ncbi:hypothetical protein [Arthrobacter sp. Z4-13]
MKDSHLRREYIQADADEWAPRATRRFDHGPEVAQAWTDLRRAIQNSNSDVSPFAADAAIAEHINRSLAATSVHEHKYIRADERGIAFASEWTADEIADAVAKDIVPDAQLTTLINSARTTPESLTVIRESAKVLHKHEIETDAAGGLDSYDGPHDSDLSIANDIHRLTALSFPAHPSAALSPATMASPSTPTGTTTTHRISANFER